MKCDKNAVNIGAVQIIRDTFDARVIFKAVFSSTKYKEPAHNPVPTNKSSSLTFLARSLRGHTNQMHI